MKRPKDFKRIAGLGLILLGLGLIAAFFLGTPAQEISRSELDALIQQHQIVSGRAIPTPFPGIYRVEGTRRIGDRSGKFFANTRLDDAQAKTLFEQNALKIELGDSLHIPWVNLLSLALVGALIVWMVLQQTQVGRAAHNRIRQRPAVRFSDVAGIEEAKSEVQEIVDFLRDPKKYRRLGGTLPKGVLLIGPPGTGKTMLAKAIAGEANASFFSAHGSDFNEVFVGVGARRVRQLFRQAARNTPAIIFIDEIDCVGKHRKLDTHGEHQQTINALLAAMDGFQSSAGIVVVAATNRPEDLDEALLRPGRFDRKVFVPYPDMKGRRAILQSHASGKPIESATAALDVIAQTTPGMSGADLANLLNEAAILSAQQGAAAIALPELEAARDKVRFGKERKSMVLKKTEREMVAFHEAGHTIVHLQTALLPPLYKVSIVPRGQALGVTTLLPDEDQNLQSKRFLLEELLVLMGGRAAEKTFFGSTTNGAAGDLDLARKIARKMVLEWGMGERLYYEPEQRDAEKEINRLLETADRDALAMIHAQQANTEKLARALLDHETLTRDEVVDLLELVEPPHPSIASALSD